MPYYVLLKNEEFITQLDDNLVSVANIMASRFVAKIKK